MQENKKTAPTPQKKRPMSKKAKWRRRGRIAIVCMPPVFIVLIIAVVLSATVFFKVEQYSVSGSERYTAQQVWQACGLETGDNMLVSDLEEAQSSVELNLPYVESVSIKRKLPNTLTFTIVESKTTLAAQIGGEWMLLNTSGKVVELLGENEPQGEIMRVSLPQASRCELGRVLEFDAAQGEPEPIKVYEDILAAVEKTSLKGKISLFDISDINDVVLVYDGRIRMLIGVPTDLDMKLGLGAGAVESEDKTNPEQTGTLNLTVLQEAYFRPDGKTAQDGGGETEQQ